MRVSNITKLHIGFLIVGVGVWTCLDLSGLSSVQWLWTVSSEDLCGCCCGSSLRHPALVLQQQFFLSSHWLHFLWSFQARPVLVKWVSLTTRDKKLDQKHYDYEQLEIMNFKLTDFWLLWNSHWRKEGNRWNEWLVRDTAGHCRTLPDTAGQHY